MSRVFEELPGHAGADYIATDPWGFQTANKARNGLAMLALGVFQRSVNGGGSESDMFGVGDGVGPFRAFDCLEIEIDNSNSQISGSSLLVCQVRVGVRVENAAMSATPRVYNITDSSVPTGGTGVACSATADDYSGSNQMQTITFTAAAGKKKYIIQGTKSADTYGMYLARIAWDIYING